MPLYDSVLNLTVLIILNVNSVNSTTKKFLFLWFDLLGFLTLETNDNSEVKIFWAGHSKLNALFNHPVTLSEFQRFFLCDFWIDQKSLFLELVFQKCSVKIVS